MRSACTVLLLASLAACTHYQPVLWDGQGSWAEARAAAAQRARRWLAAFTGSEHPIAGETVSGSGEGRHLVLPGETLSELAYRYGVPAATLARANALRAPYTLHAGQVLAIPPAPKRAQPPSPRPAVARLLLATEQAPAAPPAPATIPAMTQAEVEATRRASAKTPPALSGEGFLWPVVGEVASGFGLKPNGARNNGVNILAEAGAPVVAAENGVVVYAGDEIPGYGYMLLISHAGGFTTAYAHNERLLVDVGEVVRRGQQVATVGATGGVGAPQLHFELRRGKDPMDPVAQLGEPGTKLASTR